MIDMPFLVPCLWSMCIEHERHLPYPLCIFPLFLGGFVQMVVDMSFLLRQWDPLSHRCV